MNVKKTEPPSGDGGWDAMPNEGEPENMGRIGSGRDKYFREIAARFIALRGAPFSLSPADINLIFLWESSGVPLSTVLEGIESSFSLRPGRPHVSGKIRTLSFCRMSVERAFERHRDRGVGGNRPPDDKKASAKRAAARTAVREFLGRRSADLVELVPEFETAMVLLAADRPEAEALEDLDGRIEAALRALAGAEERLAAERAIRREHPGLRGAAKAAAVGVVLVKSAREKHRIPYVSLFYY
jgi:hypothetical protein